MSKEKSKYLQKRESGNMMYGPVRMPPKAPEWKSPGVMVFCNKHPLHPYNRCSICHQEMIRSAKLAALDPWPYFG